MSLSVTFGSSDDADARRAVASLIDQLGPEPLDGVLFFCAADHDLGTLGRALADGLTCPTVGCTDSGQIGPSGFEHTKLQCVGFRGGTLALHPYWIRPLEHPEDQVADIVAAVHARTTVAPERFRFGLLLIDGLSMREEHLIAALYQGVGNLPIIGGSAGDDLRFEKTSVYDGKGQFHSDAAMFVLVESQSPVATMKVQHFQASTRDLVITRADPERRIIYEINGEPAAEAYAEALGIRVADLSPSVFSCHPIVLSFGTEPYVRSIQKYNPDGSLTCYCAIDEGLIVTIGDAVDPFSTLSSGFDDIRRQIPDPAIVIGCDCILRRLEFEDGGLAGPIGALMASNKVFGFSTYGEQFNGIHVNQTFTAVAIGA